MDTSKEREAFEKLIPHLGTMTNYQVFQAGVQFALEARPAPARLAGFPWKALLRDVAKAKQQLADFGFRASYLDWIEMQAAPAAPAPHPDTKDAERYRKWRREFSWALPSTGLGISRLLVVLADARTEQEIDTAIDAAIAASIGKGGAA